MVSRLLSDCMNQTLIVHSATTSASPSPFGVKDYTTATARSYRCRFTEKAGMHRLNEGQSVPYTSIAWVDSTGNISVQDKVTAPNGSDLLPIVGVETYHDEAGVVDHQVVMWSR